MAKAAMCSRRDLNPYGHQTKKAGRDSSGQNPYGCPRCKLIRRECSRCELERLRAVQKSATKSVAKLKRHANPELRAIGEQLEAVLNKAA